MRRNVECPICGSKDGLFEETEPGSADAAFLTEKLIQAAVDYEAGRCNRRELSQARAVVEAAIVGAPSDWPDHIKSHQQQVTNLLNEIERLRGLAALSRL